MRWGTKGRRKRERERGGARDVRWMVKDG